MIEIKTSIAPLLRMTAGALELAESSGDLKIEGLEDIRRHHDLPNLLKNDQLEEDLGRLAMQSLSRAHQVNDDKTRVLINNFKQEVEAKELDDLIRKRLQFDAETSKLGTELDHDELAYHAQKQRNDDNKITSFFFDDLGPSEEPNSLFGSFVKVFLN